MTWTAALNRKYPYPKKAFKNLSEEEQEALLPREIDYLKGRDRRLAASENSNATSILCFICIVLIYLFK